MTKSELTPDNLSWLVKWRSETQRTSMELYSLLHEHRDRIRESPELIVVSQALVATAFSLWRAVFLTDKEGTSRAALDAAEEFLGKLILDNAINYVQDRTAREWTFNYYLHNAFTRLVTVDRNMNGLVPQSARHPEIYPDIPSGKRAKATWERMQSAFSEAVWRLKSHLDAG